MTIGFDLGHDRALEFWRSNIKFALSQPKIVQLPWNEKQIHRLNSRPQMWPLGLTLAMTLTLNFQGQIWNLLCLSQKWSNCYKTKKQIYRMNSRVQMWLLGLTLAITLTVLFSRSNVTLNFDHTGVRSYHIVIGVTSDVGVPPTRLVHVESQLLWFATDSQIKRMVWGCTIEIYTMTFISGNSARG